MLFPLLLEFLDAQHPPELNQSAARALTMLDVSNATYLSILRNEERRGVFNHCLQPSIDEQNKFATMVLSNVSRDKESWKFVPAVLGETMQALLILLAHKDFCIRQCTLEAIAFFALDSNNKTLIGQVGGIQKITDRLYQDEGTIPLIATATLVNLARCNSSNKDIINASRGVLYLIGLLDIPGINKAFLSYAINALTFNHAANQAMMERMEVKLDIPSEYRYSEDPEQQFTAQECIGFFATQRAPTSDDSKLTRYLCSENSTFA